MSRVQLALNVESLDDAVDFYRKLFATEPAKRRPGYANFVIADPPLKLVLIEGTAQVSGGLNHLGVEFESTEALAAAQTHLASQGLVTAVEDEVTCCFAVQDKVWVSSPGGVPWEFYTVLGDADSMGDGPSIGGSDVTACCAGVPNGAAAHSGSSPVSPTCC